MKVSWIHPVVLAYRSGMALCFMAVFIVASLTVGPAEAHQPSYSRGEYSSRTSAWPITDIDLSIVLYHSVVCEAPELWLRFDAIEPREIFFQLGIPQIDRLSDYRPSIALLAWGLPEITEPLPFEVPEGLGGIVLHTQHLEEEPEEFFEPFTQTSSWILLETTESLPHHGTGYLVAWHPEGQTGKLWVAVGEVEDFTDVESSAVADWMENTQSFHEVPPFDPKSPIEEITCEEPEAERDEGEEVDVAASGTGDSAGCGINSKDVSTSWWMVMALRFVLWSNRRLPVVVD